jgi:lantibiotic modifying enzyme
METTRALELAVDAATFIESQRRGAFWAQTTEPEARVDHTLYHGTAGVIVFLLELADATGDQSYADRALAAGRELLDVVGNKMWASVAFATGWAGYAFAFHELAQRADDLPFAAASTRCLDRLLSQASVLGNGIGWIEPMPFSDITGFTGDREVYDLSVGAAGSALTLLQLGRLEQAVSVGERLLEIGETTPDGTRWGLMSDMPFPFTAPNFAHGGAGVGYLFARLYEVTNDERYLDAARDAARYVAARFSPVGNGALACHTEEQHPPEFYLGQCHGPAGTGRLFSLLGRLTGDSSYAEQIDQMLQAMASMGAPEARSWGWWNNHGRCCGDAGLGDAALLLAPVASAGQAPRLRELAHRCAGVIEANAIAFGGGSAWSQAEHRARPKFLQTQTGYMQGAAGIGSFLVHLATAETDKPVRIALPDDIV